MDTAILKSSYTAVILASFAAALGLVAFVNYRVDPAHIFDEGAYAKSAASLMSQGKDVLAVDLDERLLQAHFAAKLNDVPPILVLGSSRAVEIGTEMVPGAGGLHNASLSTATLPDLLALVEIFVASRERRPRTIVIGIDPWTFESKPRNNRWHTLANEYRKMLARLGGGETLAAPKGGLEGALELISIAYLLRSLEKAEWNFRSILEPRRVKATLVADRQRTVAVRRADGSLSYPADYDARSSSEVTAAALFHAAKHVNGVLRTNPIDDGAVRQFEALVVWLRERNLRVVLLLAPFHPVHYAHVREKDTSASLDRIAATVRAVAMRQRAEVIGSFDPQAAGCTEDEFRDGIHARPVCLRRILGNTDWRKKDAA